MFNSDTDLTQQELSLSRGWQLKKNILVKDHVLNNSINFVDVEFSCFHNLSLFDVHVWECVMNDVEREVSVCEMKAKYKSDEA